MSGATQQKAIETTARAVGDRVFEFVISNGERDRDNDRIDPLGWQLAHYNGIVLWQHDRSQPAVARSKVWIDRQAKALKARAEFPPDDVPYPLAHAVRGLLAAGVLTSASVGFRPMRHQPNGFGGLDHLEQELWEWSIVNIPALPSAAITAQRDSAAVAKWLAGSASSKNDDVALELDDDPADDGVVELPDAEAAAIIAELRTASSPAARAGLVEPRFDVDVRELRRVLDEVVRIGVGTHLQAVVGAEVADAIRRARGRVD